MRLIRTKWNQVLPQSRMTRPSDQGMDLEDDNKENHDGSNRELSNGLIISGLGTFGSIFLGSVLLEFVRVIVLMALLTPLLSRLKGTREDLLTRGRIMGYLEANAGIHFSALRDALGWPTASQPTICRF